MMNAVKAVNCRRKTLSCRVAAWGRTQNPDYMDSEHAASGANTRKVSLSLKAFQATLSISFLRPKSFKVWLNGLGLRHYLKHSDAWMAWCDGGQAARHDETIKSPELWAFRCEGWTQNCLCSKMFQVKHVLYIQYICYMHINTFMYAYMCIYTRHITCIYVYIYIYTPMICIRQLPNLHEDRTPAQNHVWPVSISFDRRGRHRPTNHMLPARGIATESSHMKDGQRQIFCDVILSRSSIFASQIRSGQHDVRIVQLVEGVLGTSASASNINCLASQIIEISMMLKTTYEILGVHQSILPCTPYQLLVQLTCHLLATTCMVTVQGLTVTCQNLGYEENMKQIEK